MSDPVRWREDPSKPHFKGLGEAPPLDESTRERVRNQLLAATAVEATPSLAWRAPVLGATAVVLAGLLLWRFAPQTDPTPAVALERDVAAAVDQAVASAPVLSALTVTSAPTQVDVWVDGEHRGVTPLTLNLPPGAYALEGRKAGYDNTHVAYSVLPDERSRVHLSLAESRDDPVRAERVRPQSPAIQPPRMEPDGRMGTLRVNTRPHSRVFVNGRDVGFTPVTNLRLPAGRHTLRFVYEGGEDRMRVTIEAGRTRTIVRNFDSGMSPMTSTVVDPWAD